MPILRLEIPENCFDCPYKMLKDVEDESWFCGIFQDYIEGNIRLQDCIDTSMVSLALPKQELLNDVEGRN